MHGPAVRHVCDLGARFDQGVQLVLHFGGEHAVHHPGSHLLGGEHARVSAPRDIEVQLLVVPSHRVWHQQKVLLVIVGLGGRRRHARVGRAVAVHQQHQRPTRPGTLRYHPLNPAAWAPCDHPIHSARVDIFKVIVGPAGREETAAGASGTLQFGCEHRQVLDVARHCRARLRALGRRFEPVECFAELRNDDDPVTTKDGV
mmetsp:Transcript_31387/g.82316  ORF Transcript_31387/g.82316 Transcript_31387/m.82316 type:complete len:201 (-) Transcript_31387:1577-2179(-)